MYIEIVLKLKYMDTTTKIRNDIQPITELEELEDPTPTQMPIEERIRIFANIIVDRILEVQKMAKLPAEIKQT